MARLLTLAGGFVVAALLVASCGADLRVALPDTPVSTPPADDTSSAEEPAPQPTPTPPPEGRAVLPEDQLFEQGPRLAIQTADDQIVTTLGDGSNLVPLTNPAEGTRNAVPTWSLDASRLAWVTTDDASGRSELRSARFDGSDWFEQSTPTEPFYLAWDPSSSQVATLAPGDLGLELGVVSLPDETYAKVDDGSPLWFSWSPDADGFLVHASGHRLDFVPTGGPSQVLDPLPGAFQAPRWLNDAVELVFADQEDDEDFLVVTGADGGGRRALVTYDGYLQFTVAPQSGLIALQVIDPSRAPTPEVITASFQNDEVDAIDPIPRNELTVMATFGGDPFVLYPSIDDFTPRPVLAFYWSPDGNSLAWLVEIDAGDGDCGSETALYEWQFWTGTQIIPGPRFTPTPTFACDYVPFFDQFDQSLTFWSPDSALFTYAGTSQRTGERGIWNTRPGTFEPPELIADGEVGIWSAEAAGSAAASAA